VGDLLHRRGGTAALIVAVLALLAAAGGIGYAAGKLSGKSIKKHSIPLNRLTKAAQKSLKGQTGPQGPAGADGSARAVGYIIPSPQGGLDPARSRGFTAITRKTVNYPFGSTGTFTAAYCLTPATGIDAGSAAPIASPLANSGFVGAPVAAMPVEGAPDCSGGQIEVIATGSIAISVVIP
jgi:hypothetical protein